MTHVHLLVLPHVHADHVEGLPGVLEGRRVDEVMVSPLAQPAELAASVTSRLAGANVPTTIAAAGGLGGKELSGRPLQAGSPQAFGNRALQAQLHPARGIGEQPVDFEYVRFN